jgi:pimeloyl-ACP methyl ester carboxylesterase/DNA-binding CsgD family transcriptional regulator
VERGERVLRELIAVTGEERYGAHYWAETARVAALVVDRTGIVTAANNAARRSLGLTHGSRLDALPLIEDDLAVLCGQIERISGALTNEVHLLRLRMTGENAPILVRIVGRIGGDANQIGLLTSIVSWPEPLSVQLKSAFRLTQSELDVLKDLALGLTVTEIAEKTDRGDATIRTHVKALLAKTGVRSQLELVRVTIGMREPTQQTAELRPMRSPKGVRPDPNDYQTIKLSDGRKLDYLVIGDTRGRPFLLLPTDMGFTRLPPSAEDWLTGNGMRMIVPVRAGYGASSPLPTRRNAFDVAIEDMFALCDELAIGPCPILALCDDFHLAVAAASAAPERVTGIVALGPTMPATEKKHFERMTKWTRFIFASARYAPRTLPYVAMAFFQFIRRVGPQRSLQTFMVESEADLSVLQDDDTLMAMLRGSEISIGPNFTAHAAWAAGAVCNYAVDWSKKLADCPVPMVLFAGHQDPFAPIATTREFAGTNPRITLHEYPEFGQLLYPVWPRFLAEVEKFLGR